MAFGNRRGLRPLPADRLPRLGALLLPRPAAGKPWERSLLRIPPSGLRACVLHHACPLERRRFFFLKVSLLFLYLPLPLCLLSPTSPQVLYTTAI